MLLANGCTRAIKEGLGAYKGGDGSYRSVRTVGSGPASRPLASYTKFALGEFTDDTGGYLPVGFDSYLRDHFQEALLEKGLPNYSGKKLLLRGRILYYEKSGMFGQVFGPLEEVVARVEMVDADSGDVIGSANVVGRSKSTTSQGVETKAEGLAEGLVKWISDHYPEQE
jgi:hypothetical protein